MCAYCGTSETFLQFLTEIWNNASEKVSDLHFFWQFSGHKMLEKGDFFCKSIFETKSNPFFKFNFVWPDYPIFL